MCRANADNCWVYFLAVFAASPRCVCTNSIRRQNRGEPGWRHRRRANTLTKLSSFVRIAEDSDRGSENTGAAGTGLRRAPGNVPSHRVAVCGQQRQTVLFMLADYFIRIAQFQQTTSNVVHALRVGHVRYCPHSSPENQFENIVDSLESEIGGPQYSRRGHYRKRELDKIAVIGSKTRPVDLCFLP
jgi:hypothetical protein